MTSPPATQAAHPTTDRSRARDKRTALWVFLAFAALYLTTGRLILDNTDGELMYQNTVGILHGHLWIESDMFRDKYPSHGLGGRMYSPHGIGQPVLSIPLYLAGAAAAKIIPGLPARFTTRAAVMALNPIVTAIVCAYLFWLLRALGFGVHTSLLGCAVYGLGTMAWPYSKTYFSDPLAGLLVLATAWHVARARDHNSVRDAALAGVFAGLGMLVRHFGILVAPVAGLMLVVPIQRGTHDLKAAVKSLAAYAIPTAAAALLWGCHNWARYGEFATPRGPDTLTAKFGATPIWVGLSGLLISPGKGLLWYAPVTVLAIVGFAILWRSHRTFAAVALALIAFHLGTYATFNHWDGAWSWGPRFLVAVLPLIGIAIGAALSHRSDWSPRKRRAALALIAVSVAVQVLGCSVYFTFSHHTIQDMGVLPRHNNFEPRYSALVVAATLLDDFQWSPLSLDDARRGMPSGEFKRSVRATLDYWPAYAYRFGIPWPILLLFPLQLILVALLFRKAVRTATLPAKPEAPPCSPTSK